MSGKIRGRPDFLLLFVTMLLVGFGLIMIFSASSPIAAFKHNSPGHYVMKQGVFALIGLFVMLIFMGIPYTWWRKAAVIGEEFGFVGTLLLMIVFFYLSGGGLSLRFDVQIHSVSC